MAESQKQRIGARIRSAREARRGADGDVLSQRELARMLPGKVDGPSISRWERGIVRPGDGYLDALADALEVDVSFFLVEEPQEGTPDLMGRLNGREDHVAEMLTLLRGLDERLANVEKMLLEREMADLEAAAQARSRRSSPGTGEAETS